MQYIVRYQYNPTTTSGYRTGITFETRCESKQEARDFFDAYKDSPYLIHVTLWEARTNNVLTRIA